jgi:tetraspanin-18
MGCCKDLAVILLVIVNFVFAAAGLLMLAFGIAAAAKPDSILQIFSYAPEITQRAATAGFDLESTLQESAVFLIVLGAVVAVMGLFGCIGACCKVKWMLGVYVTVLIIILLAEIALIIFAAVFPDQLESKVRPAMLKSLSQYKSDGKANLTVGSYTLPGDEIDLAWASLQFEVGCCGTNGYLDYYNASFQRTEFNQGAVVPVSCCKQLNGPRHIATMKTDFVDLYKCLQGDVQYINDQDCYTAVELLIKQYTRISIGIAAAIIGIEIILIILSMWICRSIVTSTKSQTI